MCGNKQANVVCRELGFESALEAVAYSKFGTYGGTFGLNHVRCSGNESSVFDCSSYEDVGCGPSEVAGVVCKGQQHSLLVNFGMALKAVVSPLL